MIGLAVLAGLAVYIAVAWFAVRALKQKWAKALAILIALAIPFWDLPIGYYSYQDYCSSEGGLHVSIPIAPQQVVFFDSIPSYSANELLALGIKVVEIARPDGKGIARHEIGGNGTLQTKIVSKPESSVRVSYVRNQKLPWNILREDRIVTGLIDGRVFAKYSEFSWWGGWLHRTFAPFLGSGLSCAARRNDPIVTFLVRGGEPTL